jgi:aminomethyltransferase
MLSEWFAHRGVAQAALPDGGSIALRFTSAVDEHLATRRGVALFDFSFMGWWELTGTEVRACLERLQTRDLAALTPGTGCYTLLCREDASVFIDATVWPVERDRYWLVTGRQSDGSRIAGIAATFGTRVEPLHERHAVIAIQGPASTTLLEHALPQCDAASLRFFAFRAFAGDGYYGWIARLGYTGELGYELVVPDAAAVGLWNRLLHAPLDAERAEGGMEAANSLRIEAGFIHFAHELRERVLPAEIGLSRLVRPDAEGTFIGSMALPAVASSTRRLAGVVFSDGTTNDRPAGSEASAAMHLTSEAWSPTFERTLGLGLVDASLERGAHVVVRDGRHGVLADLPFYRRRTDG